MGNPWDFYHFKSIAAQPYLHQTQIIKLHGERSNLLVKIDLKADQNLQQIHSNGLIPLADLIRPDLYRIGVKGYYRHPQIHAPRKNAHACPMPIFT